jgi:hypothetical protein
MEKVNYSYYQFHKDLSYPVFVRFDSEDFGNDLLSLLSQLNFLEISDEKEVDLLEQKIANNDSRIKILTLSVATIGVVRQIDMASESDQFGPESLIPREGYRVYRWRGLALMVYSFAVQEWKLGCFNDFGHEKNIYAYQTIMNRFLSWALFSQGVIGFWGVPVDEGLVVLRQSQSKGEVVFIDINKHKILSIEGVGKIPARFKVLRLDPALKGKNMRMTSEELLSFLALHTSFLDTGGLNFPIRQLLRATSLIAEGLVHSEESFRPRTDLAL